MKVSVCWAVSRRIVPRSVRREYLVACMRMGEIKRVPTTGMGISCHGIALSRLLKLGSPQPRPSRPHSTALHQAYRSFECENGCPSRHVVIANTLVPN